MSKLYIVEIVEFGTDQVVYRSKAVPERQADKIDDGLNINLNHERFFTRVVQVTA